MLEGKRVRLVPVRKEFLPKFTQWMNDREVLRYLYMYKPLTLEAEEKWYTRLLSDENEILLSILTNSPAGEEILIGNVGITVDHRNGVGVLGIVIGEKEYWGKGLGTEALQLMIAYGFDTLNLQRVELQVFSSNPRAIASYTKIGFREEGRRRRAQYVRGQYIDLLMLGLLKEEFQQNTEN